MDAEYNKHNLSLTHYTYSDTAMVEVNDIFGYRLVIKGKKDLLENILAIASVYCMKVHKINDETFDN